jgi:hypothetical protein
MRRFTILLTAFLTCSLIGIAGCPNVQIAHPVCVGIDTFGFEPKWADKHVVFVQVLIKDPNSKEKVDLPALVGSCSGSTAADIKELPPFRTVWAIRALNIIPATTLILTPGEIPDGFEQILPSGSKKFVPVSGKEYYILACLEPVDYWFYSVGIKWTQGKVVSDLLKNTEVLESDGPYRNSPSGMVFPVKIRGFTRADIRRYDSVGLDVGVGYNLNNPFRPIAATIYVYPARTKPGATVTGDSIELLNYEFEEIKKTVFLMHKGARFISEETVSLKQAGVNYPGRMATFDYEDAFAGMKQPVRSHLYVFCHPSRKWMVKYRFTHPQGVDASDDIKEFMENLLWTIGNSQ